MNFNNIQSDMNESIIFDKTLKQVKTWLDEYFKEKKPDIKRLLLNPKGSEFQNTVWNILLKIPYGKTMTYGEIANQIAIKKGIKKMSSRAIGAAVGHNPITVIIPCHRVLGVNNKLTGYSAGIDRKMKLLELENRKGR